MDTIVAVVDKDFTNMADKYRRVDKPAPEQPNNPNEIRLTAIGRRKNYISYAIGKLTGEQPERSLILKGM